MPNVNSVYVRHIHNIHRLTRHITVGNTFCVKNTPPPPQKSVRCSVKNKPGNHQWKKPSCVKRRELSGGQRAENYTKRIQKIRREKPKTFNEEIYKRGTLKEKD